MLRIYVKNQENERFDDEWIMLLKEAKQIGLTPREVRAFFKNKTQTEQHKHYNAKS